MKHTFSSVTFLIASLYVAGLAWAKSPFLTPPKGGIPQCKADLAVCQDTLAALDSEILVIDDVFVRRLPGSTSGSGHTVEGECPADPSGNDWQDATASLVVTQSGYGSKVEIEVEGATPYTLFTVWVRLKGSSHGANFGSSPITGGGATPLANSADMGTLVADWIGPGSSTEPNGFRTDGSGEGSLTLDLDFPVVGGSYPFNGMNAADLALAQSKRPVALAIPTTIVNPTDSAIDAPFLLRILSHCQDDLGHGLSPGNREAWFQYP
jgi:hypothetical protein